MSKWIIQDWMSNHVYKDKTFDSFEDARDFISEVATKEANKRFDEEKTPTAWNELYDGICDDLYAIEVKETDDE